MALRAWALASSCVAAVHGSGAWLASKPHLAASCDVDEESSLLQKRAVMGPIGSSPTCAKEVFGTCVCPGNCPAVGVSCDNAVGCGEGSLEDSGSCTPYWFQPNAWIETLSSCAFLDDPKYQPNYWVFNPTNRLDGGGQMQKDVYQAWQTGGADDIWLIHGCDGAGIQGDCLGDNLYLEQFGPQGNVQCTPGTYGVDHPECGFVHPANANTPSAGVGFEWYNCGWQRTYEDPDDADILSASLDGGLLGPGKPPSNPADLSNDGASNWALTVNWALSHCIGCDDPRGALAHTFRASATQPNAYLTGSLSPWTCSTSEFNVYTQAFNDCYCDNEPWGGRVGSAGAVIPEPNWNTKILYCGFFKDDPNNPDGYLQCDIISIIKDDWSVDGCHNDKCGGYSIKNNHNGDGQTVGESFRLDLAAWPR